MLNLRFLLVLVYLLICGVRIPAFEVELYSIVADKDVDPCEKVFFVDQETMGVYMNMNVRYRKINGSNVWKRYYIQGFESGLDHYGDIDGETMQPIYWVVDEHKYVNRGMVYDPAVETLVVIPSSPRDIWSGKTLTSERRSYVNKNSYITGDLGLHDGFNKPTLPPEAEKGELGYYRIIGLNLGGSGNAKANKISYKLYKYNKVFEEYYTKEIKGTLYYDVNGNRWDGTVDKLSFTYSIDNYKYLLLTDMELPITKRSFSRQGMANIGAQFDLNGSEPEIFLRNTWSKKHDIVIDFAAHNAAMRSKKFFAERTFNYYTPENAAFFAKFPDKKVQELFSIVPDYIKYGIVPEYERDFDELFRSQVAKQAYWILKPQAESWPCRLMSLNLTDSEWQELPVSVYALLSAQAFDVSPKGNLLLLAEKDPQSGLFKHWSIYRIILDAQLMADRVRLRAEASVSSKVLASLNTGAKVKLLDYSAQKETINGQEANWFKVRLANKTEGWVFGAFLESDECKLLPGIKK